MQFQITFLKHIYYKYRNKHILEVCNKIYIFILLNHLVTKFSTTVKNLKVGFDVV